MTCSFVKLNLFLIKSLPKAQVWSMDRSFHTSFAALSGSFDGSLELWDLRGDEPLRGAARWNLVDGDFCRGWWWLVMKTTGKLRFEWENHRKRVDTLW